MNKRVRFCFASKHHVLHLAWNHFLIHFVLLMIVLLFYFDLEAS